MVPKPTWVHCSGLAGAEWTSGGILACLLVQNLSYFSANKQPALSSLVEDWGYQQLCYQKPCHVLSRDGYPRTIPGRECCTCLWEDPQGYAIMTWVGSIDILRHPPLKPSAATHRLPKVRMVEADLGFGAEAQDCLCLSQDLFPLKLRFLKNTNEIALPVSSVDASFPFSGETTSGLSDSSWRQSLIEDTITRLGKKLCPQ